MGKLRRMLRVEREDLPEIAVPLLEKRSRWLRNLVRAAGAVFCLVLGSLAVAWAMPQQRKLKEKELRLLQIQREEASIRRQKEIYEIRRRTLLEGDRDFIETEARDRLDRCRPGERVFRFVR
jgi:cell division protein FtsB